MAKAIDIANPRLSPHNEAWSEDIAWLEDDESDGHDFGQPNDDDEYSNALAEEYQEFLAAQRRRIHDTREKRVVLSLDGGGIRGLSTLLILRKLMEKIAEIEKEQSPMATSSADSPLLLKADVERELDSLAKKLDQKRPMPFVDKESTARFLPCHYFDYIAGTSTGGLAATMLGRLGMSVERAIDEFTTLTEQVYTVRFRSSRTMRILSPFGRSPDEKVKECLLGRLGQFAGESLHDDEERCKTFICSFEQRSGKQLLTPLYFRSYSLPEQLALSTNSPAPSDNLHSVKVTDVLLATGCDPYRSSPVRLSGRSIIDTGFLWPNPTGGIFEEFQSSQKNQETLIVSLGCGYVQDDSELTVRQRKSRGRISKSSVAINRALYKLCEQVHKTMLEQESLYDLTYYRFNAGLDLSKAETHIRSAKSELRALKAVIEESTNQYLKSKEAKDALEKCALALVDTRRQRCVMPDWAAFAFGNKNYRCTYDKSCSKRDVSFSREGLKEHIMKEHIIHAPKGSAGDEEIHMLVDRGKVKSFPSL